MIDHPCHLYIYIRKSVHTKEIDYDNHHFYESKQIDSVFIFCVCM
jgi:hypothetical protein